VRFFYRTGAALAFVVIGLTGIAKAADAPPVVAQTAAASTISGKVTDSSGGPLGGATVSATGGGHTYRTTSATDGSFSLSVPPGVFTVTVNRGGFQTAQNDVAVTTGSTITLSIPLSEQNLQSLREIGRTSTTFNRAPFNISESSVSALPPIDIAIRQAPNLTDVVGEIPGVVASRTFSSTPNTNFVVRGGALQTRVTIDGHPISSGTVGQWNTNYANSLIFQGVEVVKGSGLNGSIAGESAVGTVNLRTRDFTRNNSAGATMGFDSYNGGLYNVFADVNFLNNKASLIVQKAFQGFNGPWGGTTQFRSGATSASTAGVATGQPTSFAGLTQWTGDFSNAYATEAELVKFRYRFSETSSVTLEYLGLQGQYQPQGGSYAAYIGNMTISACQNGSAFQATLATCLPNSTYTAPYTFSKIGQMVNAYSWFPNSYIQNNEPTFAAEFRTAIKNDTLLVRPYTHLINRFISGTWENHYPGNGGGWFAVTNVANCQAIEVAPTAAGGAKGPCFPVTTGPNGPAYIGSSTNPVQYKTTPTAPVCSPTPPYTCFTTVTGVQNDGTVGFSTPFSQPELDRLNGYTVSYIHPVGDNVYNFSYDYRKDYSQFSTADTSGAAAGCTFVIGSVSGAAAAAAQPGCSLVGLAGRLPRSSISIPPTVSQYGDFALTGSFQLNPKLRLAIGNYFEIYKLNAQIEDPKVLNAFATAPGITNAGAAPVALIPVGQTVTHYDPHIGLEFRASRDLSLRASAGSSITQPYPGLVSGFGSISIPNAANGGNYTNSIPNFNIKPETTIVYDVGLDQRLGDGGVLSFDAYDMVVHDVFLTNTSNIGTIPGVCGPGQNSQFPTALCLQTNSINGPIQRGYGLEVSLTKNPINGFGYYLSGTLQRSYLDQLPLSIYFSNTTPTNGNFNINGEQLYGNPFFKAYGQLLYNDVRGNTFELGADYEGSNNYTFGPPYVIYDAGARIPIVQRRVRLQLSVQNLFNLNTGTLLGRALMAQGNVQPTVWLDKTTGTLRPGNGFTYTGNGQVQLQALPPRNVRLSFDFSM
jgi:hypothetical protein